MQSCLHLLLFTMAATPVEGSQAHLQTHQQRWCLSFRTWQVTTWPKSDASQREPATVVEGDMKKERERERERWMCSEAGLPRSRVMKKRLQVHACLATSVWPIISQKKEKKEGQLMALLFIWELAKPDLLSGLTSHLRVY